MSFFKPNKEYIEFLKDINALQIAYNIQCDNGPTIAFSLPEFFIFRERIIEKLKKYDLKLFKKRKYILYSKEYNWGYYWISNIFEIAFETKINLKL